MVGAECGPGSVACDLAELPTRPRSLDREFGPTTSDPTCGLPVPAPDVQPGPSLRPALQRAVRPTFAAARESARRRHPPAGRPPAPIRARRVSTSSFLAVSGASCHGLAVGGGCRISDAGRHARRQHRLGGNGECGAQSRILVRELQRAAVELCDRLHQTQAQAHARRAAAGIAPIKALDHLGFFRLAIPGPLSVTAISTVPSARRWTVTSILPLSGAYFSALSIRLLSACASSTGSPATRVGPSARRRRLIFFSSAAGS